jgi:hypothetical protein
VAEVLLTATFRDQKQADAALDRLTKTAAASGTSVTRVGNRLEVAVGAST